MKMEQNSFEKSKIPYIQWIATLSVFTIMLQAGIEAGWSSPNVARFLSKEAVIKLTPYEISWVISLFDLGSFVGSIVFSIALELIGSRRSILGVFITIFVSWFCLQFATHSVVFLYISRLAAGLVISGSYMSFSIYLGEVVHPKIRGTMISAAASGFSVGVVLGITTETYITSMKKTSFIYLAICVLSFLLFLWLKDSPYYFVKTGNYDNAKESTAFYFPRYDVDELLEPIKMFVEASANENMKEKVKKLNSPVTKRAICMISIIYMIPQLSGQMNVLSYMETILKSAKSNLIQPQTLVIYANIISSITTLVTVRVSDKFGRRAALILSSIGTSIGMGSLGLHFFLLKQNMDAQYLQWLPIFSIICYLVTYAIGYAPVPSTLLSELFPENLKSIAAGIAICVTSISAFAIAKSFQLMVDTIGEDYIFWLYALLSLLAIPYALFLLLETKGKTFQEIQNDLIKK